MERFRLNILVESRIRGNVYVRFGGEHWKTDHSNMARRRVLSLHRNIRVLSSLDTSSFDALPSGIQLELPCPADYGIDATEPISLQRACNLAKSLAKQ